MRPAKMDFPVRKGFTLVELLIVTVIIGILAGSLLLVFGSARNRSTSTRVISDLMTLKRVSSMFYYDTGRWPGEEDYGALQYYIDRDALAGDWSDETKIYGIRHPEGSDSVFAAARVSDGNGISLGVRESLEKEAPKYNLVNEDGITSYTSGNDIVMVLLRILEP